MAAPHRSAKFVFVTGGVVSSIGKGIVAASLGRLLKSRGYSVSILKLDPYLNVDPGTMSPFQHGEVFVTEDGAETDLPPGWVERRFVTDMIERTRAAGMPLRAVQLPAAPPPLPRTDVDGGSGAAACEDDGVCPSNRTLKP